jgi:putative Mg2+ transporter-C (MgtC) family protein
MNGAEMFVDTELMMFGKLALALVLGLFIGTERGLVARQQAGTRTFGLVAVASCLLVVVGNQVVTDALGMVNFDPTRLAAAIVQGIGFLGAGLIIVRGESVHGATTAAGLWLTSAIGLAVGFGLFSVAIFSTLLMVITLTGLWFIEHKWKERLGVIHPDTEHPLGH